MPKTDEGKEEQMPDAKQGGKPGLWQYEYAVPDETLKEPKYNRHTKERTYKAKRTYDGYQPKTGIGKATWEQLEGSIRGAQNNRKPPSPATLAAKRRRAEARSRRMEVYAKIKALKGSISATYKKGTYRYVLSNFLRDNPGARRNEIRAFMSSHQTSGKLRSDMFDNQWQRKEDRAKKQMSDKQTEFGVAMKDLVAAAFMKGGKDGRWVKANIGNLARTAHRIVGSKNRFAIPIGRGFSGGEVDEY